MERTKKRELSFDHKSSLKEDDLNKLSRGCAPCLGEAIKIDQQINKRSLNEIKIDEIKNIVRSIFKGLNNDTKKN